MKEKNGFILEVKNIKKTFITGDSKVEALKGISFCLKRGEMLAVDRKSTRLLQSR